jgi:predicted ester cyclase
MERSDTMAVDIKQSSRRLIEEAFGKGNFDSFDEICDPAYRAHNTLTGDSDLRKEKDNCRMYRTAFPDLKPTILASLREGDVCVTHWRMTGTHQKELMGVPAKGVRCTAEGISIDRYKGAKLLESWTQWDALGLMRQLGVAMPLAAALTAAATDRQHHA